MNGGLLFHVAGIPVRVLPFFFMVALLFGFNEQQPILIAAFVVLMFLGILLHELGHAFAYRVFGVQPEVVLHGFGGLTFGRSLPVAKDLVVSLAGPAVGVVIGGALWIVDQNVTYHSYTPYRIVQIAIFVNLGWALLNLLPILPMDGGNAANAMLSLLFRRDMTRPTQILSIVTAAVMIVVALYLGYVFGLLLLGWFIFMNVQALSRGRSQGRWTPSNTPSNPPMNSPPPGPGAPSASPQQWPSAPPTPPPPPGGLGPQSPPTWGPMPDSPPVAGAPTGWPPSGQPPSGQPPGGQAPGGRPTAPADAGFIPRPSTSGRTFGDEMSSATRSLATGHPELAAISVDRARRLAANPDEHAAVDRLEAHVTERLAGPST